MSEEYANIAQLQRLAGEIKQSYIKDLDKTKEIKEVTKILTQINAKKSLEDYFHDDKKSLDYFKDIFLKSVIPNILHQPYVSGKNGDDFALMLLIQVYKLFISFHKYDYPKIFEIIRSIFKGSHNTYFFNPENAMSKSGLSNEKKKYTYDIFNQIFCSEFIGNNKQQPLYEKGDYVDILINHSYSRTQIDQTAWVRGKIKKVENGLYYVNYNGEEKEITFPIGSKKIQPKGKKTADWEWRTNLKKYDLVDVYDRDQWWPCTICDIVEQSNEYGIKEVKYRIGFRLYLEPFNNKDKPEDSCLNYSAFWESKDLKLDEDNKEYLGDEKEKDEEIFHFSRRIQKFNTYSETQLIAIENKETEIMANCNEELTKDDYLEDNITNDYITYEKDDKKNIIIGKATNQKFLYFYAMLLKRIENDGDFDKFIQILKDKPNLNELYTIFTILYEGLDYIHEQYIEENKEFLKNCFFEYINHLNDKEIINLSTEFINMAKKFMGRIFKENNDFKIAKEEEDFKNSTIEEEASIIYILSLINSNTFDKRLQGIKELNDFIFKSKNKENALKRAAELIKEKKTINEIFGSNYHSQIILKSSEVLKLLLKYNQLDEEEIQVIWSCTQKGDSDVKNIIIDLLMNIIGDYLTEDFIGKIMNSILNISNGIIDEKEINFAYKLSLKSQNQENKKKISQYFCNSIFLLTDFCKNNPVFRALIRLMNNDENYIIKVLEICQQSLIENKHTLICNSLILEIFNNYVTINYNDDKITYKCLKGQLEDFLKDGHLLKIFEDNFEKYMEIAKEKCISEDIHEASLLKVDGFDHVKNVEGRFSFLNSLTNGIYPNYDFTLKLKKLFIDNPVFPDDKSLFFKYMDYYCFPKNTKYANETRNKARTEIFKIFKENNQEEMTYLEFKLFIQTFIHINSSILELKIVKIYEDELFEINFKSKVEDDEIKEIDQLWVLLSEVKDEKVINKIINVIYQTKQDKDTIIDNIIEKFGPEDNEENEEKMKKCFNIIKLFLIETEKNHVIDIKSHYSLLKNSIIKFPLEIGGLKNDDYIELYYDNSSLNELKEDLMKKYKIPMEFIEANILKDNEVFKLDYTYNNKSLKEIILDDILKDDSNKNRDFNKILFFRKIQKEKEDLIEDNNLSQKFKNILSTRFIEATEGSDKMDKESCKNFFSEITNYTDNIINDIFKKYDNDENGFLTEENIYQYYSDILLKEKKEKEVRDSLFKMGYNEYLLNIKNVEVEHDENEDLFRYKLSNNGEEEGEGFINLCFNNYNIYPQLDYDLLFFLPTNENIYYKILENKNPELFDDNILKQLYNLIIIESILQDIELKNIEQSHIFKTNSIQILSSRKYEPFTTIENKKKIDFLVDFIKKKYEKLIKYNINVLNKYKKTGNLLAGKCFRMGLKIMIIIYEACLNFPPNNNLIEGNIYYIDYSHINCELKDKEEVKKKVNAITFKILFHNLLNYILDTNNIFDDFYNDCFSVAIKLLAYKENLLEDLFANEKNKKSLCELILKNLASNPSVTKCLTDTLKKSTFISSSLNSNKFIIFICDIIKIIFDSISNNNNKFFSNEFFDFFIEINECIYHLQKDEKEPNNKLLLLVIEMLINNLNENDKQKKISNEIFYKYMELILELIKKNENLRKEITSYKLKDKSLSSIIVEKIIFGFDENTKNNEVKDNNIFNENEEFISIDKNKVENDILLNKKIKEICTNYVLESLKNDDIYSKKEIIKINMKIKEIRENKNNNQIANNNKKKPKYNENQSLKAYGHVGLKNLGATCYMNSIMQQLFMVTTFRYAILDTDDHLSNVSAKKYTRADDDLLHQLQVMYTYLTLSDKQYFTPDDFCFSFKDDNGRRIDPKVQQDSQEFYNNFCDKIEKKLEKTKYKYIINDIFTGKTCSTITCKSCKYISNKFEDFYNLQLEVKNIKNLNESLQKLITPETIEGYRCSSCKQEVTIQKRTTLYKLPNTLIVHLKRFCMNYDYGITEKINTRFEFPMVINLKSFCVENFQNKTDEIYYKNEDYYKYILKGVNVHLGDANGGHYISLIDVDRNGTGNIMRIPKKNEKPNWLVFNDSSLSEFNLRDIESECFGNSSKCAYLLIYEKVKKTPIKIVLEDKYISKDNNNIIKYNKESLNKINEKYDIYKINNQFKEEDLYNLIFYNSDIKEYYKYIHYYNIPKNVPKILYNKVMDENNSLHNRDFSKNEQNNANQKSFDKFEEYFNTYFLKDKSQIDINLYDINEKNNIINLAMFNIINYIKNYQLTEENKKQINYEMEKLLNNIIKVLISDTTDMRVLENLVSIMFNKNVIEKIFKINEPVFDEKIVKEFFDLAIKLMDILYFKNRLTYQNIKDTIVEYYKDVRRSSNYNGNYDSNPIKYIYKILYKTIENTEDLVIQCLKDNLIFLLFSKIENEHPSNHETIFNIVKTLIRGTEDFNKKLFPNEVKEKNDVSKEEFPEKNLIRQLFLKNKNLNHLLFDIDRKLLIIILKIFENKDQKFTNEYNISLLPELMEYSIKSKKVMFFLELCFNLIDIKDNLCIERMKQIIGIPTMIIKPNQKNQKWPLFGFELIKSNNNDLKTQIYRYTSIYKNKFCILSYVLPDESEPNENNEKKILELDSIKTVIYQLIIKCLINGGNYCLFKYLYLLPARSISYNNAYEELKTFIANQLLYKLDDLKSVEDTFIEKINYELNELLKQRNPNSKNIKKIEKPKIPKEIEDNNPESPIIYSFLGFIPDFIPGEIAKEEVQLLNKTDNLELIRIEYFTKYYNIEELNDAIKNGKQKENINDKIDIKKEEIIDEKENVIKVDISNRDYQKEENKLLNKISKKLQNQNKLIVEDGTILDDENIINSLVRYILINKKPIKNKIFAKVNLNQNLNIHAKDNICYTEFLCDYVDRHNYVDFLDINRIKKGEKFIKKDDIYINLSSKAYLNKI